MQIYVPFAPGGSADGIARILAAELGTSLNRQIVVINQPGAGGTFGLITASKAAPDGDTLAIAATGALVINPHLPTSNAFDTLKELTPVAKLIDIPIVMVASATGDLKSITAVIERAKSSSGGVTYGTTGVNSSQHLAVELLKTMTGANFVHVPYRGSAPAVTDVLGGQIPMASVDLTSAHPAHQGRHGRSRSASPVPGAPRPHRKSRPSPKAACRAMTARRDSSGCSRRPRPRPRR